MTERSNNFVVSKTILDPLVHVYDRESRIPSALRRCAHQASAPARAFAEEPRVRTVSSTERNAASIITL
eukprot:6197157-Pleurochrysis_carterae.AAC.3